MPELTRSALIDRLANLIDTRRSPHPVRVAIDGPDAAGKTTLADELAARLDSHRSVIRASIDGFHLPADVRRRRGPLSPEGCYHDSFDTQAIRMVLLEPLGTGGDRRYRAAVFDLREDIAIAAPVRTAPVDAVVLVDGVFLLRPELRDLWDLAVYVAISPQETVRRAVVRDAEIMGGPDAVRERYAARYLPAQDLYRIDAAPADRADVVVDNENVTRPRVKKWPANENSRTNTG